jgi:hypothetical protein
MTPRPSLRRSAFLVALFALVTVGFRVAVKDPLRPDWTKPVPCKRVGDRMVC